LLDCPGVLNHLLFLRHPDRRSIGPTRDGVAYLGNKGTMRMVADPEVVIVGDPCWGFCHEVGHVLQMRPQMTWGGMTEVSNNIFTLYHPDRGLSLAARYEEPSRMIKPGSISTIPRPTLGAGGPIYPRDTPALRLPRFYARQGSRLAQVRIRLASSSSTNVSLTGSNVSLRPSIQAMAPA